MILLAQLGSDAWTAIGLQAALVLFLAGGAWAILHQQGKEIERLRKNQETIFGKLDEHRNREAGRFRRISMAIATLAAGTNPHGQQAVDILKVPDDDSGE